MGAAGQVRPRRSDSDEEAHRPPHGKRATWSGNQLNVFLNKNKVCENSLLKNNDDILINFKKLVLSNCTRLPVL